MEQKHTCNAAGLNIHQTAAQRMQLQEQQEEQALEYHVAQVYMEKAAMEHLQEQMPATTVWYI